MNFIRRLFNRGNFYLLSYSFKFLFIRRGWKWAKNAIFQHNISKFMPARQKTQEHGMTTTIGVSKKVQKADLSIFPFLKCENLTKTHQCNATCDNLKFMKN